MSAPAAENVKAEPSGPPKQEGQTNDGVKKFQNEGGNFRRDGNKKFQGNRGNYHGNNNQNFNRNNRFSNNKANNFNRDQPPPKKDLMSIDTSAVGNIGGNPGNDGSTVGQQGGGGGGGGANQRRPPPRNQDRNQDHQSRFGNNQNTDRFAERVATISGPTIELPPIDTAEKKFAGRCRLYVGNLTNDTTKEELEELFTPFGEVSECFINAEKMFAFIRLDYRANAEKAKRELDGLLRKGRQLRVRFAPHSAAIKVKNLNQFVTNELLEWAFQVFGEIERAVVIADERGKSTGEGIVEFARKPGAMQALRRCAEGCYFITSSLRPVIVEPYDYLDDLDGYSEKSLFKKSTDFFKEREVGPRFAASKSFEAEYGQRWKALSDLFKQKEEALKREMKLEEEKLEAQMEYARYEHETEMLRNQLRQREQDKERQKREWELKERAAEEARRTDEDILRRQADELKIRLQRQQEEDLRRRNEIDMFSQARELTSLLEQQEQALGSPYERQNRGPPGLPDPKSFLDALDARQGGRGPIQRNDRSSRWGGPQDRRGPQGPDDYQNKRRRY